MKEISNQVLSSLIRHIPILIKNVDSSKKNHTVIADSIRQLNQIVKKLEKYRNG